MDMITAQQAADKWGVSVRYIQVLCKNGKIPGATKFGLNWMIPANAKKPKDGRGKSVKQIEEKKPYMVMPVQTPQIIMSRLYHEAGSADACIAQLSETPYVAALFEGWLAFNQGKITKALDLVIPLLDIEADYYGTLNTGMLTMACAIWKNDAALWRKGRAHVASVKCPDELLARMRDFWLGIHDADILTNNQSLSWYSWAEFHKLPEEAVAVVLFFYAKYMHKISMYLARGEAEFPDIKGLGMLRLYPYMIEPMIVQVKREGVILAEISMRLFCADAYLNIGMKEAALTHLDMAISLALPDKLYGILAEARSMLNTMLDERIEIQDSHAAKEVKRIYKEMFANWTEMTKRSVALELTERQKEIARLASLGLTNQEIADRLQISYHTVKATISMIIDKTGAQNRFEFTKYIF